MSIENVVVYDLISDIIIAIRNTISLKSFIIFIISLAFVTSSISSLLYSRIIQKKKNKRP